MEKFDFYQISALFLPGAVFVYGLTLIFPAISIVPATSTLSIGSFGLFAILSYVAGNLIQGIGNIIASIWWFIWRGKPTDWVRQDRGNILHIGQINVLMKLLKDRLHYRRDINKLGDIDRKDWHSITGQMIAYVRSKKESKRIEIFLSQYGLYRGLSAAFMLLAALVPFKFGLRYSWAVGLLTLALIISLYRMHRFSKYYAEELFMEFLNL
jgi:hypothetical protein